MGVWRRRDIDSVTPQINAMIPIKDAIGRALVIKVSAEALLAVAVMPDHASASQWYRVGTPTSKGLSFGPKRASDQARDSENVWSWEKWNQPFDRLRNISDTWIDPSIRRLVSIQVLHFENQLGNSHPHSADKIRITVSGKIQSQRVDSKKATAPRARGQNL